MLKNKSQTERQEPALFLIGNKGAGKTCFIGGMSIYAQTGGNIFLSGLDDKSKSYLQTTTQALLKDQWPRATSGDSLISILAQYKDQKATISVLEYAGEILAEAFRGEAVNFTEDEHRNIVDTLRRASHILLVLDGVDDFPRPETQEMELRRRHEELFDFLGNALHEQENGTWQIAILLTKCDLLDVKSPSQARRFIRKNAAYVYEKVKNLFNNGNNPMCFPVSIRGENAASESDSSRVIPNPYGYEDFFEWLFGLQKKKQRYRKKIISVIFVVSALAAGTWVYWSQRTDAIRARLENPNISISAFVKLPPEYLRGNRDIVDRRIDRWVEDFRKERENNPSRVQIERIESDLEGLLTLNSTRRRELQELHRLALEDLNRFYYSELEDLALRARKGDVSARTLFMEKREAYRSYLSEATYGKVQNLSVGLEESNRERQRQELHSISLTSRDALGAKAKLTARYVWEYMADRPAAEREEILEAVKVAERLAAQSTFDVSLRGVGAFAKKTISRVIIETKDGSFDFAWSERTKEATWDETKTLRWNFGQAITVKIEIDGWFGDYIIRETQDSSPLSIRLLSGRVDDWDQDRKYEQYDNEIDSAQRFHALFSIRGFSENDWRLLERYFYPGDFWK
jgi:hypothetical protein